MWTIPYEQQCSRKASDMTEQLTFSLSMSVNMTVETKKVHQSNAIVDFIWILNWIWIFKQAGPLFMDYILNNTKNTVNFLAWYGPTSAINTKK